MVSTTVALLESLCVVIITYQDKRPPKWLRRISSGGLARLFCLKDEIPDIPKENTEWKSKTQVKCQVKVSVDMFKYCHVFNVTVVKSIPTPRGRERTVLESCTDVLCQDCIPVRLVLSKENKIDECLNLE